MHLYSIIGACQWGSFLPVVYHNLSVWLDCGTFDSLLKASNFVSKSQAKQKNKIACLEEIAFKNKWISRKQVKEIINVSSSSYGNYLTKVIS